MLHERAHAINLGISQLTCSMTFGAPIEVRVKPNTSVCTTRAKYSKQLPRLLKMRVPECEVPHLRRVRVRGRI